VDVRLWVSPCSLFQVVLKGDSGGGVRLPARLLALHSCLFDDMFQDMLAQQEEEADDEQQQAQEPQVNNPVSVQPLITAAVLCLPAFAM
jgi:hypothetical protein